MATDEQFVRLFLSVKDDLSFCEVPDDFVRNKVIWNFAEGEIIFHGQKYPLSQNRKGERPWCRRVVLAEDQVIPPRYR